MLNNFLGNHEFYGGIADQVITTITEVCSKHKNLQFFDRTSGTLVVCYHLGVLIDGVRFLGCVLWSFVPEACKTEVEMSMNDFRRIKLSENKSDVLTSTGTSEQLVLIVKNT